MPGLTVREAEMRLLNEIPIRAPAGPQPQPGTLPCGCPRHLAPGCVCYAPRRLPAGLEYLCWAAWETGAAWAPPAAPLSRTAVSAPSKTLSPPPSTPRHSQLHSFWWWWERGAVPGLKAFSEWPHFHIMPSFPSSIPLSNSFGDNFARFSEWD